MTDEHSSTPPSTYSTGNPPPCDCGPATVQIISLCQHVSSSLCIQDSQDTDRTSLANTLNLARRLVQHWGTLNGCAHSESHLDAQVLCSMVDSIDTVLRSHEKAIGALVQSQSPAQNAAFVGQLELDAEETAIVVQEALKHSLIRLAAMLQDVEEEVALLSTSNSKVVNPLQERDIRGLSSRLFRLLGNVNRLQTV